MKRINPTTDKRRAEHIESLDDYEPETELGAKLLALRHKIIADPRQALTDREVHQEVSAQRDRYR